MRWWGSLKARPTLYETDRAKVVGGRGQAQCAPGRRKSNHRGTLRLDPANPAAWNVVEDCRVERDLAKEVDLAFKTLPPPI